MPVVLGQHRLIYIVASDGDELVLVDQHTAHERVRFERLLDRAERRMTESQGLLVPAVVELAPSLRPVLEAHVEGLRELGYDVEPFGGGATRLRAVPAVLGTRDPGPALEAILRDLRSATPPMGGQRRARPARGDARLPLRGARRSAAGDGAR